MRRFLLNVSIVFGCLSFLLSMVALFLGWFTVVEIVAMIALATIPLLLDMTISRKEALPSQAHVVAPPESTAGTYVFASTTPYNCYMHGYREWQMIEANQDKVQRSTFKFNK